MLSSSFSIIKSRANVSITSNLTVFILHGTDAINNFEGVPGHRHKNRRSVAQTPNAPTVSLQQVRQEVDKKLSHVCTAKDKLCQVGPQGPPGDPDVHGYPGYKGEKGVPGITGPQGPLGPAGAQGPSGKQGRQGPQGIKGEKGQKGSVGPPGVKGDVGAMGRPGEKGSIGFKGDKGNRGAMGLRGPKGQLVVSPKIRIFPVSQEVSINQSAVFYCWVDGHTTLKTTWRKLGGASIDEVKNSDVLHIKNVKRSHAGSYSCSVFTGYGIFRVISTLEIRGTKKCFQCAQMLSNGFSFTTCFTICPHQYDFIDRRLSVLLTD